MGTQCRENAVERMDGHDDCCSLLTHVQRSTDSNQDGLSGGVIALYDSTLSQRLLAFLFVETSPGREQFEDETIDENVIWSWQVKHWMVPWHYTKALLVTVVMSMGVDQSSRKVGKSRWISEGNSQRLNKHFGFNTLLINRIWEIQKGSSFVYTFLSSRPMKRLSSAQPRRPKRRVTIVVSTIWHDTVL